MPAATTGQCTFGFVTVVARDAVGCIGGYLVLNARARPLEFHCTAPVQTSRAQEILFGPTLKPYLYGEQIAKKLIEKSKLPPTLLVTDLAEILESRSLGEIPMVLVPTSEAGENLPEDNHQIRRLDMSHPTADVLQLHRFHWTSLGPFQVATQRGFDRDLDTASRLWEEHGASMDLHEPFTRIREAIQEAQRPSG